MSGAHRVSIGLPVYNGEKFLAAAIDSVLAQTFTNFELIISDNGSTDNTRAICERYAARDPRVKYYRVEQNRGAAWNFNRVIELSTGEFFKWQAADDLIGATFLERCLECLDADPGAVLAMPRAAVIDGSGERLTGDSAFADQTQTHHAHSDGPRFTDAESAFRWDYLTSRRADQRYKGVLLYSIRCYEEFGLMRMSAIRQTGWHRSYRGSEKVFLTEMAIAGRFVEIPEILFFNRWHDDRFSALVSAKAQVQWVNPHRKGNFVLPRQLRCTLGYAWTIVRRRMRWYERLGCVGGLLQFGLSLNKWKSFVAESVHGGGMTATAPQSNSSRERKQEAVSVGANGHSSRPAT